MQSKCFVKGILTLCLTVLIVGASLNVHAEEPADNNDYSHEVVPGTEKMERWSYTSSVSAALTISSSGYATSTSGVTGYQDLTTRIITYSYLQKYNGSEWVNVTYFSNTTNGWYQYLEQGFGTYAVWGHDYRVYNSIYVYAGSSYEHIKAYSIVHHYHSTSDSTNCTN
ncbi:hypothetical protein [Frisingicoccus sp.]|uniref:hypothetical protein n=1 Tax=Frisingicoccus sp. TaxID=1918627 RepID=UPI00386AB8B8